MHPNPRKTQAIRRLANVDISQLRDRVLALPEEVWEAENAAKPNRYGVLDSTRHIVFRFVSSFIDWRSSFDLPLWAQWQPVLEPIITAATAPYGYAQGALSRVMLARMAPGGIIHPHQDQNPAAKWPHKIHVPIVTNDKVTFYVAGTGYHLAEGEAVEVNNMATHGVTNEGAADRIHLIFEYYDADQPEPEWLEELAANKQLFVRR